MLAVSLIFLIVLEPKADKDVSDSSYVLEDESIDLPKDISAAPKYVTSDDADISADNGIKYYDAEDDLNIEDDISDTGTDNVIVDGIVHPADQFFEDWNDDGVNDLVRKDIDGKFYVFINYGTDDAPVYNESYIYSR